MAVFIQRPSGNWQARIRRDGWPAQSKTFPRKADAEAWATKIERDMDTQSFIPADTASKTTFEALAGRYAAEVLPKQRGAKTVGYKLNFLVEHFGELNLMAITPARLAAWRDQRLTKVGNQTVRHELGLISRVFKAAEIDWGIPLPNGNPVSKVRKPSAPAHRTRRLQPGEYELLVAALGECAQAEAMLLAFDLAIETAARRSELLSLQWQDVSLQARKARLRGIDGRETKNGDAYREVPLSPGAVAALQARAQRLQADNPKVSATKLLKGPVLGISASLLTQAWDGAVKRARRKHLGRVLVQRLVADHGLGDATAAKQLAALIYKKKEPLPITRELWAELEAEDQTLKDLHWHDLRHEATSRLAERLEMHELMKVTGHKSSTMLAAYYHPDASRLAEKIDPKAQVAAELAKLLQTADETALRRALEAITASKQPEISG